LYIYISLVQKAIVLNTYAVIFYFTWTLLHHVYHIIKKTECGLGSTRNILISDGNILWQHLTAVDLVAVCSLLFQSLIFQRFQIWILNFLPLQFKPGRTSDSVFFSLYVTI